MKTERPNKNMIKIYLIWPLILLGFIAGCAKKNSTGPVIASINSYEMTVEDFNYESKEILHMRKLVGEIPFTKEGVLDALIVKELLIQEAQRKDYDKDREFMKSIELHWEQTLLKNLISSKSREIEEAIVIYDGEIADYYRKIGGIIQASVVLLTEERGGRELMKARGDIIAAANSAPEKYSVSEIISSRTYRYGENDSTLSEKIFQVDGNKDLFKIDDRWALIIIEERQTSDPGAISGLKDEIRRRIRARKEKQLMDEWIDSLRSGARIKINKKILSELH